MIVPPVPAIPTPTLNPTAPSFPTIQGSTNVLATLLGRDEPECTDISHCRTTTNIVLSCLSTIFACTWVALHLDVLENPNQSAWRSFRRKLRLMICALIAPEIVAAMAMEELSMAKEFMDNWNANFVSLCSPKLVEIPETTAKQYEDVLKYKHYDSRWTLTHGFLARMKGIRLYTDDEDNLGNFLPTKELFENPVTRPAIQRIGLISSKDIEDKSKGDWFSKFFVVIQTTWFIVQCLARWAAHLSVTELEVATLAYAALNLLIYVLWWNKPQGLSVPYRFYVAKEKDSSGNLETEGDVKREEVPLRPCSPGPASVDEAVDMDTSPGSETRRRRNQRDRLCGVSGHEWVQPTYSGSHSFFITLGGYKNGWLFAALVGTIFGGLHLIPIWLSVFPSNAEKILWWVSAFLITAVPAGVALVGLALHRWGDSGPKLKDILGLLWGLLVGAYATARVILLVLPFTTLRSLPVEAFLNVTWTTFIPHF